jgi:hypothetical protein
MMSDKPTLSSTGAVFVSLRAGQEYVAALKRLGIAELGAEEARRELTELLLDAVQQTARPGDRLETWRSRSRKTQLDISVNVARERRLAVVVTVRVREHRQ